MMAMNMDLLCLSSCQICMLDSGKHIPVLPIGISHPNASNDNTVQDDDIANTKIQLSVCTKELIDEQKDDDFCIFILKLIDDNKVSPVKYFRNDR